MRGLRIIGLLSLLMGSLWGVGHGWAQAAEVQRGLALTPYAGTYVGQWRLLDFRNVPYVELTEYLNERELGRRDTLRVEAQNDSVLQIKLQEEGVRLRVVHYKAYVREHAQHVEVFFRVEPGGERARFRYRSADGRLQLTFSVVGGAGGYSYLGAAGYEEGDGSLRAPEGSLDAQCVVECVGTFDGRAVRMEGTLRVVMQRDAGRVRMDARCRGCI